MLIDSLELYNLSLFDRFEFHIQSCNQIYSLTSKNSQQEPKALDVNEGFGRASILPTFVKKKKKIQKTKILVKKQRQKNEAVALGERSREKRGKAQQIYCSLSYRKRGYCT